MTKNADLIRKFEESKTKEVFKFTGRSKSPLNFNTHKSGKTLEHSKTATSFYSMKSNYKIHSNTFRKQKLFREEIETIVNLSSFLLTFQSNSNVNLSILGALNFTHSQKYNPIGSSISNYTVNYNKPNAKETPIAKEDNINVLHILSNMGKKTCSGSCQNKNKDHCNRTHDINLSEFLIDKQKNKREMTPVKKRSEKVQYCHKLDFTPSRLQQEKTILMKSKIPKKKTTNEFDYYYKKNTFYNKQKTSKNVNTISPKRCNYNDYLSNSKIQYKNDNPMVKIIYLSPQDSQKKSKMTKHNETKKEKILKLKEWKRKLENFCQKNEEEENSDSFGEEDKNDYSFNSPKNKESLNEKNYQSFNKNTMKRKNNINLTNFQTNNKYSGIYNYINESNESL